jgi:hypothetical protein
MHAGSHGKGPPRGPHDPSLYGMHDGKLDDDDDPPDDAPAADDTPLSDPPLVTAEGNLAGERTPLTPNDTGGSNPAFDFSGGSGNSGGSGSSGGAGSSGINVDKILPGWAKEIKEHVTIPMSVQDTTNPMPGSPDYTPPGSKMCADNAECGDDVAVIPVGPPVFKKDWVSHPVNPSTIDHAGPLTLPDARKPGNIDPIGPDENMYTGVPTTSPESSNCAVTWRVCGYK